MADYDIRLKTLIVGDRAVGKTSLLNRATDDIFSERPPNVVEFKCMLVPHNNKMMKLQIFDISNRRPHECPERTFEVQIIWLVYDIGYLASFNNLKNWLKRMCLFSSQATIILVGNKKDTAERAVTYDQGKQFAEQFGFIFMETSAKTGHNVERVMLSGVNEWYSRNVLNQWIDLAAIKKFKTSVGWKKLGSIVVCCNVDQTLVLNNPRSGTCFNENLMGALKGSGVKYMVLFTDMSIKNFYGSDRRSGHALHHLIHHLKKKYGITVVAVVTPEDFNYPETVPGSAYGVMYTKMNQLITAKKLVIAENGAVEQGDAEMVAGYKQYWMARSISLCVDLESEFEEEVSAKAGMARYLIRSVPGINTMVSIDNDDYEMDQFAKVVATENPNIFVHKITVFKNKSRGETFEKTEYIAMLRQTGLFTKK